MLRHSALPLLLSLLAGVGCTPADDAPPLFNAIDRSVQCEAGKVGWDFSTGGSSINDTIRNPTLSSEIRIVEATYGSNCNITPGNWTESFSRSCNGRSSCLRPIYLETSTDPKPDCGKDFQVRYTCGVEPFVYNLTYPLQSPTTPLSLSCGDQLTVLEASYGKNCKASLAGNYTSRLAPKCAGVRRCFETAGPGNARFGSDPIGGCNKKWEVSYFCGNDQTPRTSVFEEDQAIDVSCPIRELPNQKSVPLTIVRAIGGANCFSTPPNLTDSYRRSCDGKSSCSRPFTVPGDPSLDNNNGFSMCQGDMQVTYRCGNEATEYVTSVSAAFNTNKTVDLRCGDQIKPLTGAYGKNCQQTNANNFLARFKARCADKRSCAFTEATGNGLYGGDPADRCAKKWEFTYLCGDSPGEYSASFKENETIRLECPVSPGVPPEGANGIRVNDALYGKNCNGTGDRVANVSLAVTSSCYGKDVCDFKLNYTGPALAPSCTKDLDVTYHCGEDSTPVSAHLDGEAQGKTLTLSCSPAVKVLNATYGASCKKPVGNATVAAGNACNGRRGRCALEVSTLGDPAPGCTKDFSLDYACGEDPTVKSVKLSGDASKATAVMDCPTPSKPYVKKACVPAHCRGRERRDVNLNCAKDLTLPRTSYYTQVAVAGPQIASGSLTTFKEDTVYELDVGVTLGATLAAPREKELTTAVVWAWDEFEPISGSGSRVPGYRCAMADVSLSLRNDNDPVLRALGVPGAMKDRVLAGRTFNATLPPSCFGHNIASWRDGAKRLGIPEVDFRSKYRMVGAPRVEVSVDPEGRTLTTRDDTSDRVDTAFVPDPIGFFYEASKLWVDFYTYYRQTAVPKELRPAGNLSSATFADSTTLELLTTRAQVRNPEVEVYLFDPYTLPTLEIDFSWIKQGDAPGRNPYSPTSTPLTNQVKTLAQLNLGATVEITTKALYDQRGAGTWVSSSNSLTIGRPQGTVLEKGEASGTTTRILASFPEALRDRILRVKNGGNGGWMETGTEPMREFKVRVCMDLDGKSRSDGNENDKTPFTVTRGTSTFSAGFVPGRRCIVSDQVVVVKRVLEHRAFAPSRSVAASQAGRGIDQGNSAVNTGNDVGSQSTCQRTCTVALDCGAGQSCDNGGIAGRVGYCSGQGPSNVCTSRDRNTMGSGGIYPASLMSTTNTNKSDESVPGKARTSTNASVETLGFDVLETGEQTEEKNVTKANDTKFNIAINPNWDIIILILKGESLAAELAPIKPTFTKQKLFGRQGIGYGLGRDIPFSLGPIPMSIEFSASVGVTLGLTYELDLAGETTYPCLGKSAKCFEQVETLATQEDANDACLDRGGRLAEAQTDADLQAIKAVITEPNSERWIGAQLAFQYPEPSCASNLLGCADRSTTRYRWINTGVAFAEQAGRNPALLNSASYAAQYGGALADLSQLRTTVPTLAGVTLTKSTGKLNTRIGSLPAKSVCEFDPAASAKTTQMKVGFVTGVSAGVAAALCTPSKHAGICVGAGFNFLEASFNFVYSKTDTRLFTMAGTLLGERGNDSFDIYWEARALTGAVTLQLRMVLFSIEWDLVRFGGVKKWGGENSPDARLYHHDYPIRRSVP